MKHRRPLRQTPFCPPPSDAKRKEVISHMYRGETSLLGHKNSFEGRKLIVRRAKKLLNMSSEPLFEKKLTRFEKKMEEKLICEERKTEGPQPSSTNLNKGASFPSSVLLKLAFHHPSLLPQCSLLPPPSCFLDEVETILKSF
ncbi:unnamed protein product [Lupinus luteus]|uniref:Uncharacterized protein n=1 Tax=Lupinus luteus TaxID=3873 RepID=A0AAV1Y883_LUPLU